MLKITAASHLDHGLTAVQLQYVLKRFADRSAFFVETFELPAGFGTLSCGLYGPAMGDAPVTDDRVRSARRFTRAWPSRVLADGSPLRLTHIVTVVAGPHEGDDCVLYTVYGGSQAPQEPGDPACRDLAASTAFWAEHALWVSSFEVMNEASDTLSQDASPAHSKA